MLAITLDHATPCRLDRGRMLLFVEDCLVISSVVITARHTDAWQASVLNKTSSRPTGPPHYTYQVWRCGYQSSLLWLINYVLTCH